MSEKRLPSQHDAAPMRRLADDEGGLRAPPDLHGWRKAWWWFDFIILVKLARLRFIAILVVIGVIITQWDTLTAYYDKMDARHVVEPRRSALGRRIFLPDASRRWFATTTKGEMPDLLHAALETQEGATAHQRRCRPASSIACSSRPIASCWPACRLGRSTISR